jgi:hypothetical protein
MSTDKRFHLFAWDDYESCGVECDYEGAFASLDDAIATGGKTENCCIIEVRDGALWVVAGYDVFPPPPKWDMSERLLSSRWAR